MRCYKLGRLPGPKKAGYVCSLVVCTLCPLANANTAESCLLAGKVGCDSVQRHDVIRQLQQRALQQPDIGGKHTPVHAHTCVYLPPGTHQHSAQIRTLATVAPACPLPRLPRPLQRAAALTQVIAVRPAASGALQLPCPAQVAIQPGSCPQATVNFIAWQLYPKFNVTTYQAQYAGQSSTGTVSSR